MQSLQYAFDVLNILKHAQVGSIKHDHDDFLIPDKDGGALARLNGSALSINGALFNERLVPARESELVEQIELSVFEAFIKELCSASKVSLNHLGISYYCTNLEAEILSLKNTLGSNTLYEEQSGSPTVKWLFVGNREDPSEPLFEFVLNQRSKPVLSSWTPHIQIDIDTQLSYEDLITITQKHLGDHWVRWSIEIKDWGTPLIVGRLCSISGLKVYLGIGTDKRGRKWHREQGLHQI